MLPTAKSSTSTLKQTISPKFTVVDRNSDGKDEVQDEGHKHTGAGTCIVSLKIM